MNRSRPLLLAATGLLLLCACSQPEDLPPPDLAPQFGGAAEDYGVDLALGQGGQVQVLALEAGIIQTDLVYGEFRNAYLRRYDRHGKLLGAKRIAAYACDDSGYEDCSFSSFGVHALHADGAGNLYALLSSGGVVDDSAFVNAYSLYKLSARGDLLAKVRVGTTGTGFGDENGETTLRTAVDAHGNLYVAKTQFDYDYGEGAGVRTNVVAKYAPNGALQWQRTSSVGAPRGIVVSSTGNVYVVGKTGVGRYTASGELVWTRPGGGDDLVISGSHLYVRAGLSLRKYDGAGKRLWSKVQTGLRRPVIAALSGDPRGNVYLAGKVDAPRGDRDAFVRKVSPSGAVLWTKAYGTSAYDDALGVATLTGTEIYTVGSTFGALTAPNPGGSDAYVRKVDASGNRLWTR